MPLSFSLSLSLSSLKSKHSPSIWSLSSSPVSLPHYSGLTPSLRSLTLSTPISQAAALSLRSLTLSTPIAQAADPPLLPT